MIKKVVILLVTLGISISALAKTGVFPQRDFDELSYGLYWFGANNQYEKASESTQDGSTYYDPSKPTLIFIHGWQPMAVRSQDRSTLYENDGGWPGKDFVNIWNSEGYNVGILYWDQFADELELKNAEAKIWSVDGKRGMRWIDSNGYYHDGPNQNVTELLLRQYDIAMQHYTGHDIRLAGHSLGNQLALRLADRLMQQANRGEIAANEVPGRVSLLDPFYSNYSKSYLGGKWIGEKARDIVFRLKANGIAIDSYRTSAVTSTIFVGDENPKLQNAVAFVEQKARFFSQVQQSEKHGSSVWLYLWSILYPTPTVLDNAMPGISASSTNDEVKRWMATTDHLTQIAGGNTPDPLDNIYETDSKF